MIVLLLLGFLGGLACSTASLLNSTEAVQANLAPASASELTQSPVMALLLATVLLPIAVWLLPLLRVAWRSMATFWSRTDAPPSVTPQEATTQTKTIKQRKGCFATRNQKKAEKKAKQAQDTTRRASPARAKPATTGDNAPVPQSQQVATDLDGFKQVGRGGKETSAKDWWQEILGVKLYCQAQNTPIATATATKPTLATTARPGQTDKEPCLDTTPPTKQGTAEHDAQAPQAKQVAKDSDGFQTPKPCGGKKSGQAKNIPASTHTTNSAPATASARSPHATANPRASANKVPAATSAGGGYQRAGGAHGRRSASPQGTGHQARPAWASNARQGRVPKKRPVPAPPARGKAAAAPPPAQKWTFASVVHGVFTKPEALMCDSVPLAQPSKDAFPPISAAKPAPCTVKPAPPSKKAPSPPHARKASQSLVVPNAVPHLLATATDSNNATQETPTSPLSASCVLSSSVSTGSGHASPTTSSVSNLVLPEVVFDHESDLPSSPSQLDVLSTTTDSTHREEASAQPPHEPSASTQTAEQAQEPRFTDDGVAQSHAPALPARKPRTALLARKPRAQLQCAALVSLYTHGHNTIVRSIQSSSTDSTDSKQALVQPAPEHSVSTCEAGLLSPARDEQCTAAQAAGTADSAEQAEVKPILSEFHAGAQPHAQLAEPSLLDVCAHGLQWDHGITLEDAKDQIMCMYAHASDYLTTSGFQVSFLTDPEGGWTKQESFNPEGPSTETDSTETDTQSISMEKTPRTCDVSVYTVDLGDRPREMVVKQYSTLSKWGSFKAFCSEVRVVSSLGDNPYFVQVVTAALDMDMETGVIVMQKAHGDLRRWVGHGASHRKTVLKFLIDICCAVEKLHEAGLLHGDIKPANCCYFYYDSPEHKEMIRAVLGDFGTAEDAHSERPRAFPGGTPPYMPQEQARLIVDGGMGDYNQSVDLHALGVLIHVMLTGHSPLQYDNKDVAEQKPYKQMEYICDGLVTRAVDKSLNPRLRRLLHASLSNDMDKRPSATTLCVALQKVLRRCPCKAG